MQYQGIDGRTRAGLFLSITFSIAFAFSFNASAQQQSATGSAEATCTAVATDEISQHLHRAYTVVGHAQTQSALNTLLSDRPGAPQGCPITDKLLSEIAALQFQLGENTSAEQTISEALRSKSIPDDYAPSIGVDHFILGDICVIRGEYSKAELEFKNAIRIISHFGRSQSAALSRIYQDLGMLYMRLGDLRSAESALQQSLEADKQAPHELPERTLLTKDVLMHLRYRQGRLTEATQMLRNLIADYGDDSAIPQHFRAHLYRDSGEVLVAAKKPDEAVEHLRKCLLLTENESQEPESSIVYVMLTGAYLLQKNVVQAEQAAHEAYDRSQRFERDFPQNAAMACGTYGAVLNTKKQWAQARPLLAHALEISKERATQVQVLQHLIEADHNLHQRQEERQMRRRLKQLLEAAPREPATQHTVDVMAFNSTGSH
jgi:tetratricopeptide (TPR) repeat protein